MLPKTGMDVRSWPHPRFAPRHGMCWIAQLQPTCLPAKHQCQMPVLNHQHFCTAGTCPDLSRGMASSHAWHGQVPLHGKVCKSHSLMLCMQERLLTAGTQSLNPGISRRRHGRKSCYYTKLIDLALILNGVVCGSLFRLDPQPVRVTKELLWMSAILGSGTNVIMVPLLLRVVSQNLVSIMQLLQHSHWMQKYLPWSAYTAFI